MWPKILHLSDTTVINSISYSKRDRIRSLELFFQRRAIQVWIANDCIMILVNCWVSYIVKIRACLLRCRICNICNCRTYFFAFIETMHGTELQLVLFSCKLFKGEDLSVCATELLPTSIQNAMITAVNPQWMHIWITMHVTLNYAFTTDELLTITNYTVLIQLILSFVRFYVTFSCWRCAVWWTS